MTDFSDSSQSGMLSPATTLIESFNKKSGSATTTPLPSSSASASASASASNMLCNTPTLNGVATVNGGGPLSAGSTTVANLGGRQINTSSSSCSSLKETSHQSTSTSQQVSQTHSNVEYINHTRSCQLVKNNEIKLLYAELLYKDNLDVLTV